MCAARALSIERWLQVGEEYVVWHGGGWVAAEHHGYSSIQCEPLALLGGEQCTAAVTLTYTMGLWPALTLFSTIRSTLALALALALFNYFQLQLHTLALALAPGAGARRASG